MAKQPDLVVVGGGIAGVSLALSAVARGLDLIWVRPSDDPSSQSLHWHGYLHRGHLYDVASEETLIEHLRESWRYWSHQGIRPFLENLTPLIAGSPAVLGADRYAVLQPGTSSLFRPGIELLESDERILDGPRYLAHASAALMTTCDVVEGRCVGVSGESGGTPSVLVRKPSGREARHHGTFVALATGCDTPSLAPGFPVDVRLSRMLVLTGDLPEIAFIVPDRQYGSLFAVSRTGAPDGGNAWLVSDNHSTIGREVDPIVDGWWTCSIVERLNQLFPLSDMPALQISAYHAPKARIASFRGGVQSANDAIDAGQSVLVFCPSKWTSAPLAAIQLLDRCFPSSCMARDMETSRIAQLLNSAHAVGAPPRELWLETLKHRWIRTDEALVREFGTITKASGIF